MQAAAIIGNMRVESPTLNPGEVENDGVLNGVGYGICQWSYSRKTDLKNFAKEKGMAMNSLDLQLMFFLKEYNTTGWANHQSERKTFKNTEDLKTAVTAFCSGFERCDPEKSHKDRRISGAQTAYERYAK